MDPIFSRPARIFRGVLFGALIVPMFAVAAERTKLFVREAPITVLGREATVMAIVQEEGGSGYSPEQKDGFHVEVVNELNVPTAIHWHGLILPNLQDGVPWVTQDPIPPGASMNYDFPLVQSGTYWMHSHYGLQEQFLNAAPLIIWNDAERAKADRQFVVMLSDFSFTPPEKILEELKSPSPMPAMDAGKMDKPVRQIAQVWKDGRFTKSIVERPAADIDVHYDALLANRRAIDDPEVFDVEPGETVLLRIVAASSATDFLIDTGDLDAELLAVDGKAVQPLRGDFFQLAVAQRIDLRVTIPPDGGAFPILARGEGTRQLAAVVLKTKGIRMEPLVRDAGLPAAALDNTQEKQLRAAAPLEKRPADRTLPAALGGDMQNYVWTINGHAYPNRDSLDVKKGERVEIEFTNSTMMGHPMHLHGHDFQIVSIDGERIDGALRDTVEVPPGSTIGIAFDADNPGVWAFHCHILYHLATGMFTVLKYDGAGTEFWQPERMAQEDPSL